MNCPYCGAAFLDAVPFQALLAKHGYGVHDTEWPCNVCGKRVASATEISMSMPGAKATGMFTKVTIAYTEDKP